MNHSLLSNVTFNVSFNGGGILVYVHNGIPCKLIRIRNSTNDGFLTRLRLIKKKWLLCCYYNPHRKFISNHLINIGKNVD